MSPFSVAVAKGAQSVAEYFAKVGNACVHLLFEICSNFSITKTRKRILDIKFRMVPVFVSTIRMKDF